MTDNNLPYYNDLHLPTLQALQQLGGSARVSQLKEVVAEIAGITDEQLAVTFPEGTKSAGESKVLNDMSWARTNLKKIGAADNSKRGVWSITQIGQEYLAITEEEAYEQLKKKAAAYWSEQQKSKKAQTTDYIDTEEDYDTENYWKSELLTTLKKMDPIAFERLAVRLLREAGFQNVEITKRSGDEGIDGVGTYKVSLVSFPTYFQCKRYSKSVSASAIRDFRGAMTGRGDKGLLITTGDFTPGSIAEASRDGAPPIDLISGEDLCDLLVEYRIGVRVEERIELDVEIIPEFFDNI